jgi:hypothetical protein
MQLTKKMFIHLFIPIKNQPLMKDSKWLGKKGQRPVHFRTGRCPPFCGLVWQNIELFG